MAWVERAKPLGGVSEIVLDKIHISVGTWKPSGSATSDVARNCRGEVKINAEKFKSVSIGNITRDNNSGGVSIKCYDTTQVLVNTIKSPAINTTYDISQYAYVEFAGATDNISVDINITLERVILK